MDTNKILADLYAEHSRITHAIAALESLGGASNKGGASFAYGANRMARRLPMSAAAKKKLSIAAKKRWAARKAAVAEEQAPKKAAKVAKKKTAPKKTAMVTRKAPKPAKIASARRMSAAARKRIGEATKARWAAKRAAAAGATTA